MAGLILLAGCQTMAPGDDVAALITGPTDASRQSLQNAVNDALNSEVLLADDALTMSSNLSIERSPPRGVQGQLATGRNMEPSFRFQLVLNDADCILIDTRDAARYPLENTTCVKE